MTAGLILRNVKLHSDESQLTDVFIEHGLICGFTPAGEKTGFPYYPSHDLDGKYLYPGIFDCHLHGSIGVDFNYINPEKLEHLSLYLASRGVTSFFASIVSDSEEKIKKLCQFYARAAEGKLGGARLAGIHLEGPWISPQQSGAIARDYLSLPQIEMLDRYQEATNGWIKYITIAPELDGALELIEKAASENIVVGLGHSTADYDVTREAIKRGARLATHLGNAMPQMHQRRPGIVGAILDSDLHVELIFDGIHLHPAILRLIAKTIKPDRIIGISDATMARGFRDGVYSLGISEIEGKGGVSFLKNSDWLAGSTLGSIQAIENASEILDSSIKSVYPFFSRNPARLFSQNSGEICVGMIADLLSFNEDFDLCDTWVSGKHVYSAVL